MTGVLLVYHARMNQLTSERICAIYRREAAREAVEVAAGRLRESTHASVLSCTRTHAHLILRETPELVSAQASESPLTPGMVMRGAWGEVDRLVRLAGIWDAAPPRTLAPVVPTLEPEASS